MDMGTETTTEAPSLSASLMEMVFFTSNMTPLYSATWSPSGSGSYVGTCLFLIFLATSWRALAALKHIMEQRWLDVERCRRVAVVRGQPSESEAILSGPKANEGILITERGSQESVRIVRGHARTVPPWRLSVDLPRALFVLVMSGVGYLLMLAVMTMNVGYFLSVLGGTFFGELVFGRYGVKEHQ